MRRLARLLLIVLLGIGMLPPVPAVAAAARTTGDSRPATINWTPCPEDDTAECGAIRVPMDWAQPYGPTVDVAVARRRATDPANRIGSLVVNPGGPGDSGVDLVLLGSWQFGPELTRRFDIVGFDPRGVARSHPVMCSLELLSEAPAPMLTNQADFDRLVAYNNRLGADCRRRTGPLIDHVDTLSVVRDMDAIREAVGDHRLTFYGVSYGTLLGQRYAELFPGRVRALVLDGSMDHSLDTGAFLRTGATTAQDSFDEFVRGCASDQRCALYGRDIRALWAGLMARADRGELSDPYDPAHRLTSATLTQIAFAALYGPDWFGLAEFLRTAETGLAHSSAARAGPPTRPRLAFARTAPASAEPVLAADAVQHAFPAVFCADWQLPIRDYSQYAWHAAQAAALAPDLRHSPLGLTAVTSCLGWPGKVADPQHRPAVPAVPPNAPPLLVNTAHDPATPPAWALNGARRFGVGAALLTYDGWGHSAYGRTDCVTAAVDRYLVWLALPAPGARCPARWPEAPVGPRRVVIKPAPVGPSPTVPGWAGHR